MVIALSWNIRSTMGKKISLSIREVCLFGILASLTFAAKYVMSWMPNIEPVSLMVMLFGVVFGLKALFPVYVYVVLEILFYGIGTWNINYLYIWTILALLAIMLRRMRSGWGWAILSAAFGLMFGALCMPVDILIGGFGYAASKWVSGIPFDLAHCAGNFVIAALLFHPMRTLLEKLYSKV